MIRAVLFDFDFTLGDSAEAIVHCSRAAFSEMGLEPATPASIRRTIGLSLQESFGILTGETSLERADEYRRRYVAQADIVMTAMTFLYPPSAGVLGEMRARGLATAIVSTKHRYRLESILASVGLAGAVDRIVGGDDVEFTKPSPEGLLKALAALRVDAGAALYVGDHPVDGHAASRAGVGFVRVRSGEDHGDEGWAGIVPLATIDDVSGVPGVLDRL